jgi:hypothetical protein
MLIPLLAALFTAVIAGLLQRWRIPNLPNNNIKFCVESSAIFSILFMIWVRSFKTANFGLISVLSSTVSLNLRVLGFTWTSSYACSILCSCNFLIPIRCSTASVIGGQENLIGLSAVVFTKPIDCNFSKEF